MFTRKLLSAALLLCCTAVFSQKNFTYTPEKPKPGDLIEFTYESAGDLANSREPVKAAVYGYGSQGRTANDITLTRKGYTYTGKIQTDTSQNLVTLAFFVDKKFDINNDEGYYIHLYEGDKIRKGSFASLSLFYQYYASGAGVTRDNEKALAMLKKEMEAFPDDRQQHLTGSLRLLMSLNKPGAAETVQKEIEAALKKGLSEEKDYTLLEQLYNVAKLPQQSKLIASLKKEKIPNGKWKISETIDRFYDETEPAKKKELLDEITRKVETDNDWSYLRPSLSNLKQAYVGSFIGKKDWAGLKTAAKEVGITDQNALSSLYNSAAWRIQESGTDLEYAEEFTKQATAYAKAEWKSPTGKKPPYMTETQWQEQREFTYAMYADTYAMVMYKLGKYKQGLPYAKEATLGLRKGQDPEFNTTYALLAEKALSPKAYKKELEQFVKDGKSSSTIKDILKKLYARDHKDPEGFNTYIAALEQESYLKMLEELRKSMLDETAPSFALLDLDGKKINIGDLKGKVVVVDFWATWCGPCKASFPGMQKMVSKYQDKDDVKFIFIDTWESVENKEKNASEFITKNNYSFHVLMDNDNKVVEQFKVEGIPTKFVIDKQGRIRFKSVGFDGSDDKLMKELTAMIDMAGNPEKKAF